MNTSTKGKLALFSAALIWGSSFLLLKNTLDTVPYNFLVALRFAIAAVILAVVFHKRLKLIDKSLLKSGTIMGVLLYAAYYFQTLGLVSTTPGKNAFLTAIYCVLVPFMFWATDKIAPDIFNIVSAFVCIVGIGMVAVTEDFIIEFGDISTLIGGVFFAAHIIANAKFAKDGDPMMVTMLQFAVASVLFSLTFATQGLPIPTLGFSEIATILYLAIFCSAVCLSFQSYGLKYTETSAASIILCLESVFGVMFSVMFGDEQVTLRLFIGFALIFLAVVISETKLSFLNIKRKEIK